MQVTLYLVRLAFCLKRGIPGNAASDFLRLAYEIIDGAFNVLFIHKSPLRG